MDVAVLPKEYAIISGFMFHLPEEHNKFKTLKLNPKYFSTPMTKALAQIVTHTMEKHDVCNELATESYLMKSGAYNAAQYTEVLASTPLDYAGVKHQYDELKRIYAGRMLNAA